MKKYEMIPMTLTRKEFHILDQALLVYKRASRGDVWSACVYLPLTGTTPSLVREIIDKMVETVETPASLYFNETYMSPTYLDLERFCKRFDSYYKSKKNKQKIYIEPDELKLVERALLIYWTVNVGFLAPLINSLPVFYESRDFLHKSINALLAESVKRLSVYDDEVPREAQMAYRLWELHFSI